MILLERHERTARVLRLLLGAIHRLRRAVWSLTKPKTIGVRAICRDADGRIILVRHSYVRGWFLPGGAPRVGETLSEAMLREEVGLISSKTVDRLFDIDQIASGKRDRQTIFLVEAMVFLPRLSLEIEAIGAFPCDALPPDLHPSTRHKLDRWRFPKRNWSHVQPPAES